MAITGRGTSSNPYVVHDYTEFKAICVGQGTYWYSAGVTLYIRLDGNIQSDTWENMRASSGDMCAPIIDCNEHSIKMNVQVGAGVDYPLPTNSSLQNGRISTNNYIKNARLINMRIYGGYINRSYIKNCDIKGDIDNTCHVTESEVYTSRLNFVSDYSHSNGIGSCRLMCCDIILNGEVHITYTDIPHIISGNSNITVYPSHMYRCRIRGKLTCPNTMIPNSTDAFLIDGRYTLTTPIEFRGYFMYECIVSVDVSGITIDNQSRTLLTIHAEQYKQSYIDVSSFPNNVSAGITTVTHDNVTSGNYLRNIGFPVYDG